MTDSPISKGEFHATIDPIAAQVDKLVKLLEGQADRLREAETAIAVLKDRQPSRQGAMWGAAAGTAIGIIGIIVEWLVR